MHLHEEKCAVTTRAQQRAETSRIPRNYVPAAPIDTPLFKVGREELIKLQKECPTLQKWRSNARTGKEEINRRQGIINFETTNGILYRKELQDGLTTRQVVIPQRLRQELLKVAHENPLSGHFSINKTLSRIQKDFCWPKMQDDVTLFCKNCIPCQRGSNKAPPRAPLGTPIISTDPFHSVAIDLIGPLSPPSAAGHRFAITMVDQATRYADARPLKHIDSASVAQALLEMFTYVGFPKELTSDNGSQFTSDMFQEYLRLIQTKHHLTPPYHAQSNGLVERFNGTLKNMIKKTSLDRARQKDWHLYLPALLFAYRDSVHSSTGFSPFELLYGRPVRGPLTAVRECLTSGTEESREERLMTEYVNNLRERLETTCKLAHSNLEKAQKTQKKYFDRKSKSRTFQPGEEILVFLPSPSNKTIFTWQGPWPILRRQGALRYVVQHPRGEKAYHVNHLRRFHKQAGDEPYLADPDPEEPDDPTEGVEGVEPFQEELVAVSVALEDPQDHQLDATDPSLPTKDEEGPQDVPLGSSLTEPQRSDVFRLLQEYENCFSSVPGRTHVLEHHIDLATEGPLKLQHSYPMPQALNGALKEELDKCLRLGVIERSTSPYCSPLLAVRKKDGTHRFCLDCRQLNAQTKFDLEPIPRTSDIFADLSGAKWFSKFDLTAGYWQVPLTEESKQFTAFRTKFGLFNFVTMPFGLVNAPATFSRLMRRVTEGLPDIHVYLDDVLIASKDWNSHMQALQKFFEALQKANLKAKPSKCEIGVQKLEYLGHSISPGEFRPLENKVKAIQETTMPKIKKELRSFLGAVGYYQQFIKNFSTLAHPLNLHLKKGQPEQINWTDDSVEAFLALKEVLSKEPVLQLYDPELPIILRTDASNTGIGAVLFQQNMFDPSRISPVIYASRTLRPAEMNYSTIEKEGLALYWALQKFQLYLYGRPFTLQMDHKPLTFFTQADKLSPRLKRWSLYMGLFRFNLTHIKGTDNTLPDLLSRVTV